MYTTPRITFFDTEYNVVVIVVLLSFAFSKGRDEMVKCEHNRELLQKFYIFIYITSCCLHNTQHNTLCITGRVFSHQNKLCTHTRVHNTYKMWPEKKLGQQTAMVCTMRIIILILCMNLMNFAALYTDHDVSSTKHSNI